MNKFDFNSANIGVLVGAGHGIGLELDRRIRSDFPHLKLYSSYHDQSKNQNSNALRLDPLNENEIKEFADTLPEIDFVISTVGYLGSNPEKSLKQIDLSEMTHAFQVNALHMPLLLKHLYRKLNSGSLVTVLSAMVGSVSDNHMGGWYGYRGSKAALNMFMRNMSIELRKSIVVSVHPGTTKTSLSQDFIKSVKHEVYEADQTAKHLIEFWQNCTVNHSGKFYHWSGEELTY